MWNKILGAIIVIAALFGIIFSIKFIPVYLGASELERAFSECMGNYKQYREGNCRALFDGVIEKNELSMDQSDIIMDVAIMRQSSISAEWVEVIDFFGVWQYEHTFDLIHTGKPPDRD